MASDTARSGGWTRSPVPSGADHITESQGLFFWLTFTATRIERSAASMHCKSNTDYGLISQGNPKFSDLWSTERDRARGRPGIARGSSHDGGAAQHTGPGRESPDTGRQAISPGFPGEWRAHFQGGPVGYRSREFDVVPGTASAATVITLGAAFAWNPTVQGGKSEDTLIVSQGTCAVSVQHRRLAITDCRRRARADAAASHPPTVIRNDLMLAPNSSWRKLGAQEDLNPRPSDP